MNMIHENTDTVYKVVINDEEQYSLWPLDRPNPPGWTDADKQGSYQECLDHIEKVWTDMRPRSVRTRLGSGSGSDAPTTAFQRA
jgi:MbtH protein